MTTLSLRTSSATPPPSSPDVTGPSPAGPSRPGAADRPSTSTPARSSGGCNPGRRPASAPVEVPIAAPAPVTRPRRAHPATPGGDRLRHGHQHPPDRGPAPRHPRPRTAPITRPSAAGSPTRPRRPGRSWRRSTRRASPRSGRSRWTRSFLGATDPGRDRAGEHDGRLLPQRRRPQGRDLGEATGAVRPPGVRRLRRRQGDRRGGRGKSPRPAATTPSAPALEHGLDVFHTAMEAQRVLARHWRRAEAAWEKAEAADVKVADVEAARDRRAGRGPDRPRRLAAGRSRRSSRSSGSKRPGGGPTPRWSCSAPTAGSTTAAAPRPRSPRRCRT